MYKKYTQEETQKYYKDIVNENKKNMAEIMDNVHHYAEDPEKYLSYHEFLSKFHNYSVRNRMLISKQRPGAIAVASYKKFLEMGYPVRRGEHGMKILAPEVNKSFLRNNQWLPQKYATQTEKNLIKAGTVRTKKYTNFKLGTVFDVTQTNMPKEKYPEMYPNRHEDYDMNDPKICQKLFNSLVSFANSQKIPVHVGTGDEDQVKFSNKFGTAHGATRTFNSDHHKEIFLNPANTPTEDNTVLIHELAHSQLHDLKTNRKEPSRPIAELQAEMTSYLVAKNYGIDTKNETVNYLAEWTDNGKKLAELDDKEQQEIFNGVSNTTDKIIQFVENPKQQIEQNNAFQAKPKVTENRVTEPSQTQQEALPSTPTAASNSEPPKSQSYPQKIARYVTKVAARVIQFGEEKRQTKEDSETIKDKTPNHQRHKKSKTAVSSSSFAPAQKYLKNQGISTPVIQKLYNRHLIELDQDQHLHFAHKPSKPWGYDRSENLENGQAMVPNKLVFTETPLDAMSYETAAIKGKVNNSDELNNTRFISMGGLNKLAVGVAIDDLEKEQQQSESVTQPITKISLAVGNTEAGNNFIRELNNDQDFKGLQFTANQPPKAVTWTQELKQNLRQEKQQKHSKISDLQVKPTKPVINLHEPTKNEPDYDIELE